MKKKNIVESLEEKVEKLVGRAGKKGIIIPIVAVVLLIAIIAASPYEDAEKDDGTGYEESTVQSETEDEAASPEDETTEGEKVTDKVTDKVTEKETEKVTEKVTEKETEAPQKPAAPVGSGSAKPVDPAKLPAYSGSPYTVVNNNIPNFSADELTVKSYESYSALDRYGRCGVVSASIGIDLMPTEDRGSIGSIKPTGWHTVKYDNVDGKYLYNRCHLIGFQLTGENANERNLITGTRYLNVQGMLPFENMVADYIKETENHVAYRVTPIFVGNNLLASGVQIEAYSIEDEGDGICFNVYCYNVQPDISINYADGTSSYTQPEVEDTEQSADVSYVLNNNSKKFHYPDCPSAKKIAEHNYGESDKTREELIAMGYEPCGNCDP